MNRAIGYAFGLLKYRPRSEYELRQRLKKRGFTEPVIRETLVFLKEKGLVNDCEFARIWIESRIKKPLGIYRLKQELRIKGINKELIEQLIEQVGNRYSEEEVISDLIQRRLEKLKHIEPAKAKRRIFLYLFRRGFSSEKIREALDGI
ncbi:MAG: regulatory protein RecX [Candidatus Omnitrophota bacterium]|jgi:regulatory protein